MKKNEAEVLVNTMTAKERHEESFFSLPNVCAVGVGHKEVKGKATSEKSIVVFVEQKVDVTTLDKKDIIPATVSYKVDGAKIEVKTDVVEAGKIEKLSNTARIRPARPGYSIGHFKITAGTFGCLVRDVCPPCRVHILSNNHVLANSNAASAGDPILQPGRYDGGKYPADLIAKLSRFIPINFNQPEKYNLVDAALAIPVNQQKVIASIFTLGLPTGTEEATLDMEVIKSGRTTETTTGKVRAISATVAVGYGSSGVGYFRDQIITTAMSQGGDSGSLLLSETGRKGVGLLFAGSNVVTIHNNISNVLMALGVELITA